MKKLVVSLVCLLMACFSMKAQESVKPEWNWSDRPSAVSVTFGAQSFWGMLEHGSGSMGAYSIRYDYNVLKWLAVGGRISYEGVRDARYNYSSGETIPGYTHYFSPMMNLLFTYINREHVQLYSGVGMGLHYTLSKYGTKSDFEMLPSWAVIPIGVRVGGEHVFGLAEVTLGTEAMMSLGIGVRF